MGRFKCGVRLSRVSGLPNKRDTPVKTALSRRNKCRRLLPNKLYETLPEEPELEESDVHPVRPIKPVLTSIKPILCKSALRLRSPAFTENPRGNAVLSAAPDNKKSCHQVLPAGHPAIQMSPNAEAFRGGEMTVKEEGENLAVMPGSDTSSAMESDTTFSCDDDDEEDCYSSASTASSSFPSPEIFRKENDVETQSFPFQEELLGLHPNTKNSTLLDVSHAKSIHMHHLNNLSTIIDFSVILPESNCEFNQERDPEAETKIHMDPEKACKWKTPPKLTKRKPILCKKKVWFKSPMTEGKHNPTTKLTDPVRTSIPAEQMRSEVDTSRAGEISSKEDALRLTVRLKRPVKGVPEKAKIFDFIDDSERDLFFQRMRERCDKLRSAPPFPLTAAEHTEPSSL